MNVFKLLPGNNDTIILSSDDVFHAKTGKRAPWYQRGADGKTRHYAVCPECENPVQIVNLDVETRVHEDGRVLPLYAKHAGRDIPGIADYNKDRYEDCSLANPTSFNGREKRGATSKTTTEILQLLIDLPDVVLLFIEKFLEARVPDSVFESMLKSFRDQQGYLYRAVTTSNLPFALLYMCGSQDPFFCIAKDNSPLALAVQKSCCFEYSHGRIKRRKGSKGQLRFYVTEHEIRAGEGSGCNAQRMTLVIEEIDACGKSIELHRVKRDFSSDLNFFRNMVVKRRRLRDMANRQFEIMLQ
ncbi:hypothetical protein [Cupriavidus gilardii]|uniref:hypothetical protein n=1 Tax=Cupriavidus gilardii TaxID=82541 RepID=UPI000ABD8D8A|nr:hypothetical protein [Cupriavidus gilardii]